MPIGIGPAIIASGVLGAGASIFGAGAQVSAEEQAIAQQKALYEQGLGIQSGYVNSAGNVLNPYAAGGNNAFGLYNYLTGTTTAAPPGVATNGLTSGSLTAPFTAATLASTPGYQFTLGQGLKSTQNSYAAQGLGSSGAAEKGAASYATGLAQSTYNQQFQNYLTQNQQIANMLLGGGQVGASAAETMAQLYGGAGNAALGGGVQTGAGVASSTAGIGNALAGGAAGIANSATSGVNSYLQYSLLNNLLNNNAYGTGLNGAINSGQVLGVSNGGFNYVDALASNQFGGG